MLKSDANFNETLLKVVEIRKYTGNNIEPAALDLYKCLYTVAKSEIMYIRLYLRILHNKDRDIRVPRHFKIILLSSLRHLKLYNSHMNYMKKFFILLLVKDTLESFDPLDYKSLYLLKIINQLILKGDLLQNVQKSILYKLYILCYATPLAPVRNLAVTIINTMELKRGNVKEVNFKPFLNVALITNFEDSRSRFAEIRTEHILQDMAEYMKFIHKLFHYNVHNKTAGIVYKSIISRFNVHEFQEYIWPFWGRCLAKEIEKREFRQSLVKYWIPYTVDCYGLDIFNLFYTQGIASSLLLQIIYELRRKKHITTESLYEGIIFERVLYCLNNDKTFEKSIEIFCTFPILNEKIPSRCFEIVEKYFLLNNDRHIHFEKTVNRLLAHIFITEHINSLKAPYKFVYDDFLSRLSKYIVDNLESRKNISMSTKLCKNLIEIMKKSSKDFKLLYDVPKALAYGCKENRYFLYLVNHGVFDVLTEKKNLVTNELVSLFNERNFTDSTIPSLLIEEFNGFNIEDMKINKRCTKNESISLYSLETHRFRHKIILYKFHRESAEIAFPKFIEIFIEKIMHTLPYVKISDISVFEIYEILKDLTVVISGYEINSSVENSSSSFLGISMLEFMVGAVESNLHEGLSIKTRKVVEYLFCSIIHFLELLQHARKKYANLIFIKMIILIEKSNIRKLVTDALNLTMMLSEEMEASNCLKIRKIRRTFFVELVDSICNLNSLESSKMRKHPRMRALLHVICKGSGQKQKQYVHEAISKMLVKLKEDDLNSAVHTVILECLELLMAEPCFHQFVFTYAEDMIALSLTSFESKIWTVKNAAIQLTNVLVSKFFGIQQTDSMRLRSFQEFAILFPKLTDHFFNILSRPALDEKAIIVLQYIAASEVLVYEHLYEKTAKNINKFLLLFENLLKSNESFVIKFIPHAFVSLCPEKEYGYYLTKITNFVIRFFSTKPSNIIVNHLLLFKEFIRKINANYCLLESIQINSEISIFNTVFHLNNFLRVKPAQYLDLLNIRCFSLSQDFNSCTCDIKLGIPLKKWYIANLVHNLSNSNSFNHVTTIFHYLNDNHKYNFLLEIFLELCLNFIFDKNDLKVLSDVSNLILTQIFSLRYNVNNTLYKVYLAAILKIIIRSESKITLFNIIPKNLENINLYEAIAIQIILANRNDLMIGKTLRNESFCKVTKLQHFGNFELEMLSKILLVVEKNLKSFDKYLFLKLIFYLILVDCEDENIVKLITTLGLKYVNLENCVNKLLDYGFLYVYFSEKEIVLKFLKSAMKLIENFEKNLNTCTFYLDSYDKLQVYKCIVNKLLQKIKTC